MGGQKLDPTDPEPKLQRPELDAVDQVLMKHLAQFPDASLNELGKAVGMTGMGVRKRMMKPYFRRFLVRLKETTEEIVIRAQREAAQRMSTLTRSSNERIALEACKALLNPMLNKTTVENRFTKEVIYRAQIGSQGQLLQEVVHIDAEDTADTRERKLLGAGEVVDGDVPSELGEDDNEELGE